jgi:required for meiotic nuclear division protein 1
VPDGWPFEGDLQDVRRLPARAVEELKKFFEATDALDALWDKPDLERLYARLEDEYELKERVDALDRKLTVIAETANALTDIIDTRRSLRLEVAVVLLIIFEIAITLYQIVAATH